MKTSVVAGEGENWEGECKEGGEEQESVRGRMEITFGNLEWNRDYNAGAVVETAGWASLEATVA